MHLVDDLPRADGDLGHRRWRAADRRRPWLAAQLDDDGQVVVVTFGDGATSIGAFHESLNLAALWKLPVVFVCQNNQWGEHTPFRSIRRSRRWSSAPAPSACTPAIVDGFDTLATLPAVEEAVGYAAIRRGAGVPRVRDLPATGHVATADMSYMPTEELEAATRREPVPAFRRWLLPRRSGAKRSWTSSTREQPRWSRPPSSPPLRAACPMGSDV